MQMIHSFINLKAVKAWMTQIAILLNSDKNDTLITGPTSLRDKCLQFYFVDSQNLTNDRITWAKVYMHACPLEWWCWEIKVVALRSNFKLAGNGPVSFPTSSVRKMGHAVVTDIPDWSLNYQYYNRAHWNPEKKAKHYIKYTYDHSKKPQQLL